MTDITDLAKEILNRKIYEGANDVERLYISRTNAMAKQLAQMVIDKEYAKRASRVIELEQARQEQKEKDAQIVEARGKEIGGAIDPVRTAKAIREE